MKVTLLANRITAHILATQASTAVRLFETSRMAMEHEGVFEVNVVSVRRVLSPSAALETAEFVEETGAHVLGYFDGLVDALRLTPAAIAVWEVTMDLVYTADYPVVLQDSEIAGSIGHALDQATKLGNIALAEASREFVRQSRTEGDI